MKCDSRRKLSDSSVDHDAPEMLSCLTVHPPRRRQLGCQADGLLAPGRRSASPSPVELTPSPPPAGSNPAIEGVVRWQMAAAAAAAAAAPWDAGPAELRRWYAAEVSNLTAECDALQVRITGSFLGIAPRHLRGTSILGLLRCRGRRPGLCSIGSRARMLCIGIGVCWERAAICFCDSCGGAAEAPP